MQSLHLLVNPSHIGNTKMLWRQHIIWKLAEGWLTSLPSLSWSNTTVRATYMSWCTYTHNTHPVAGAHVKEPPDCPVNPKPCWEKQERWDPHNRHGTNRQGNNGETQRAKAVSHVTLDEIEPLISLSRCKGRVLVLTHVHNWRLLLSTHDASIDVHSGTMMYTPPRWKLYQYTNKQWINTNERGT